MDVDSIPLSKLGEREIKAILDDEARQALTGWTSTARTTKGGQIACRRVVPATLWNFSIRGRDESKINRFRSRTISE
jgi:hypothetical protein